MYRVAFKFNTKVPSVNNELTIPQNKRSLDKKLIIDILIDKDELLKKESKAELPIEDIKWVLKNNEYNTIKLDVNYYDICSKDLLEKIDKDKYSEE